MKTLQELAAKRNIPQTETDEVVAIIEAENLNPSEPRSPESRQVVTRYWKKLFGVAQVAQSAEVPHPVKD